MLDAPCYIFSDAHLGAGAADDDRALASFLHHLRGRAGSLLINGDLFDFWFEYGHAIPKRFVRVLYGLGELRRAGIPVTYIGGNHDFWIGDYLARELDVTFTDRPLPLSLQGRKILLAHGDGLGPGDQGYKLLKRVLRNPAARFLFRWIHPDVGIPIASATSHTSRRHAPRPARSDEDLERALGEPWFREGYDAVVLAHFHRAVHRRNGRGEFLILGDWIERRTVARLSEGRFDLFEFAAGG